jgi:hypothetical protein
MTDDDILENERQIANGLVTKVNAVQKPGPVAQSIEMLLSRIVGAGDSLAVLATHAPHEYAFDGAMILRGIYDAMLQALYILVDPSKCQERAQRYLDFYWVERVTTVQLFEKNPTDLANRIASSPKREQAEPAIQQEFARVRAAYLDKNGKPARTWYKGNLRALAIAVEIETEYEILQRQLSGDVHASPLSLKHGPFYRGFILRDLAWRFSFRVLGKFAEYKEVTLDEAEEQFISLSQRNVFNLG